MELGSGNIPYPTVGAGLGWGFFILLKRSVMNILDEICEYFGTQGGVIRDYRDRLTYEIGNKEREYKNLQEAYNNDVNSHFSYGMLKQARERLNYVKGLYAEAFII